MRTVPSALSSGLRRKETDIVANPPAGWRWPWLGADGEWRRRPGPRAQRGPRGWVRPPCCGR